MSDKIDYTGIGGLDVKATVSKRKNETKKEKVPKASSKKGLPYVPAMLFTDREGILAMTPIAKAQAFFLTNRKMAAAMPFQANLFNIKAVNQSDVIDFWSMYLYSGQPYPPKWVYAKADKDAAMASKDEASKISKETMMAYSEYADMSVKEVRYALSSPYLRDDMVSDIKEYEKYIKEMNSEK